MVWNNDGRTLDGDQWVPLRTNLPPASQAIIHLVKCKCAKERCSTNMWMKILEMKTSHKQLAHAISGFRAPHHRWCFASSSSWIWTLFMKYSFEGSESEDGWHLIHTKIKIYIYIYKYNDDPHSCEFFRKCEEFTKDSGIYKESFRILEYGKRKAEFA